MQVRIKFGARHGQGKPVRVRRDPVAVAGRRHRVLRRLQGAGEATGLETWEGMRRRA